MTTSEGWEAHHSRGSTLLVLIIVTTAAVILICSSPAFPVASWSSHLQGT